MGGNKAIIKYDVTGEGREKVSHLIWVKVKSSHSLLAEIVVR